MSLARVVCLALAILCISEWTQCRQCEPVTWPAHLGPNPVAAHRGKVVLVALLKAYCNFCVEQARRMETLKASLEQQGYPDIAMVIINGGDARSRLYANDLISASSIPVIADDEQNTIYRQVFGGYKDDFFVFDRCGQEMFYIYFPYSNLEYPVTEQALKIVHLGRHSCYCSLDAQHRRNQTRNRPNQNRRNRNRNRRSTDNVMAGDDHVVQEPQDLMEQVITFPDCSPRSPECRRAMRAARRLLSPFPCRNGSSRCRGRLRQSRLSRFGRRGGYGSSRPRSNRRSGISYFTRRNSWGDNDLASLSGIMELEGLRRRTLNGGELLNEVDTEDELSTADAAASPSFSRFSRGWRRAMSRDPYRRRRFGFGRTYAGNIWSRQTGDMNSFP